MLISNRAGNGGAAYACAVTNCTLTGNSAGTSGGGAQLSTLYNCIVISNSATQGGGANDSTLVNCRLSGNVATTALGGGINGTAVNKSLLYNCLVTGNKAALGGGGAANTHLFNCTVTGNSGSPGGGVYNYSLNNSIVYFNEGGANSNWYTATAAISFTNTCTSPASAGWAAGNITGDPMLIDKGSNYGTNHVAGNYRLLASSPCINAGTNASWTTTYPLDFDNQQRIRYGTVDMGAYENIRNGTIYGFR